MPFVGPLPPVHALDAEAIREALDDLVEFVCNPPSGAKEVGNREEAELDRLPDRIRKGLDPTWFLLTEEERLIYCPQRRTYMECLQVALRRVWRAINAANLTRFVENDKCWHQGDPAEGVLRSLLLVCTDGVSSVENVLRMPVSWGPTERTRWEDIEAFGKIALAIADFRDAITAGLHSTTESVGDWRSRSRLRVEGKTVLLDGQPVALDMTSERREEALCYLQHLLEAAGDWRSDSEVDKAEGQTPGGQVGIRWDHVRKKLPPCLGGLIETNRRKGTRLKPEVFRRG